jgi:hypothetical protein
MFRRDVQLSKFEINLIPGTLFSSDDDSIMYKKSSVQKIYYEQLYGIRIPIINPNQLSLTQMPALMKETIKHLHSKLQLSPFLRPAIILYRKATNRPDKTASPATYCPACAAPIAPEAGFAVVVAAALVLAALVEELTAVVAFAGLVVEATEEVTTAVAVVLAALVVVY